MSTGPVALEELDGIAMAEGWQHADTPYADPAGYGHTSWTRRGVHVSVMWTGDVVWRVAAMAGTGEAMVRVLDHKDLDGDGAGIVRMARGLLRTTP